MDIETFAFPDPLGVRCDFGVQGGALAADHEIKTAVLISLFTDRRAEADDRMPDEAASRRGWWGDALNSRRIGSRLWLLSREKQVREVVNRAREYTKEALEWLVEDGVASRVDVTASVVRHGVLGLFVTIQRDRSAPFRFQFEQAWLGAGAVRS